MSLTVSSVQWLLEELEHWRISYFMIVTYTLVFWLILSRGHVQASESE